jgi:branched-chain amino acid transport system permease protein
MRTRPGGRWLPVGSRRTGRALLPVAATAVLIVVVPQVWFGNSQYTTDLAVQALILAAYGIGFNLIFGSTNQLFLCVGALAGLGGYATGILADHASWSIWPAIVVGTVIAAAVGGVMSWVAVRRSLGAIFTGIVTLAFSLAFQDLLFGQEHLTGGSTGQVVTSAAITLSDNRLGGYYLFGAVVVGFLVIFRLLQISHFGWAFRALHDDERAAELAGVDVARYRVYAAVIGSAMIGLTGALFAYSDGFLSPPTFAFDQVDVRVLVLVVFGGLGTLLGPVIGAVVFAFLDNALINSDQLRELLYGLCVVILFLGFRRGFIQTLASAVERFGPGRTSDSRWRLPGQLRRRDGS